MHFSSIAKVAAILSSALTSASPIAPNTDTPGVNVLAAAGNPADIIPNSWIIQYKPSISAADAAAHHREIKAKLGKTPDAIFSVGDFNAVHIKTDAAGLIKIGTSSFIQHVERDMVIRLDPSTEAGPSNITTPLPRAIIKQPTTLWSLSRISHRVRQVANFIYAFDSSACSNTLVYVVGTGIFTGHQEFRGRASIGINLTPSTTGQDLNGHSTHIAGTIMGSTVGVCRLGGAIAVKVLDDTGMGTFSNMIRGLVWAYDDASAHNMVHRSVQIVTAGGSFYLALNNVVNAIVAAGQPIIVGSGSSGSIATISPASAKDAITVGATDFTDHVASFSNVGPGLDLVAPGVDINSAWPSIGCSGTGCTRTLSGTTMAAAHVAGLAMYFIAKEGLGNPAAVVARLQGVCTHGAVAGYCLAYNGNGA